MNDYKDFYVVVGTAAPVLLLGLIVVTTNTATDNSKRGTAAYWCTLIATTFNAVLLFIALRELIVPTDSKTNAIVVAFMVAISVLLGILGFALSVKLPVKRKVRPKRRSKG